MKFLKIFQIFNWKTWKKQRKNKKNFPRPSGELKTLAGRARRSAADPFSLFSPRRLENLLETATAAEEGAALIFHAVSEKGKMFSTFFHFCADAF